MKKLKHKLKIQYFSDGGNEEEEKQETTNPIEWLASQVEANADNDEFITNATALLDLIQQETPDETDEERRIRELEEEVTAMRKENYDNFFNRIKKGAKIETVEEEEEEEKPVATVDDIMNDILLGGKK